MTISTLAFGSAVESSSSVKQHPMEGMALFYSKQNSVVCDQTLHLN